MLFRTREAAACTKVGQRAKGTEDQEQEHGEGEVGCAGTWGRRGRLYRNMGQERRAAQGQIGTWRGPYQS